MKHTRILTLAMAAGAALWAILPGVEAQRILSLPADFAAYRTWKPLTRAPYKVSPDLWIQCIAPGKADTAETQKADDPHGQGMIQVYANRDAERTLRDGKAGEFPVGSVLAKENLLIGNGNRPEFSGVAFMVKRSSDQHPETGGWEFQYYPSGETDRAQLQQSCSGCHKTAKRDYVFAEHFSK